MPLITVNVFIAAMAMLGGPLPNGRVTFELTRFDINGAIVVSKQIQTAQLAADGTGSIALWPNVLGSQGSQYQVCVYSQDAVLLLSALATIPNAPCNLHDVLTLIAPPVVSDAQAAAVAAQGYAAQASADRTQTGLDRTQTGQDRTASSASQAGAAISAGAAAGQAAAAAAAAVTATSQAQVAAAAAASASSVLQQDLSAVTAQALHRSPNAITAMFLYDTGKDSDGGAWIEQQQNRSWYSEALNGAWLGQFANEITARGDNLLSFPEDFTNAAWTKNAVTITADASLAPDGTVTMDKIVETAANTSHYLMRNFGAVGAGVVSSTFHVKAAEYTKAVVYMDDQAGSSCAWSVNLATGAITATRVAHASMAGMVLTTSATANGAWKCVITGTSANVSYGIRIAPDPGTTYDVFGLPTAYLGNGVNGIYSWGEKLQSGAPTAYVSNATQAGQYFQLTTDGKFYKLNATYGSTTEVQRGNKAKFPRLAALVTEATCLVMYDLTEPGRPMWMRFSNLVALSALRGGGPGSVAALNGEITVGCAAATGDIHRFNFIKDSATTHGTSLLRYNGNLAQRNAGLGHIGSNLASDPVLASRFVNAVAMTALPNAPIDAATGLPVPTIAAAVGTGNAGQIGTVLMHDGSAVNYSNAGQDGTSVSVNGRGDIAWGMSATSSFFVMPLATANVASVSAVARSYNSGNYLSGGFKKPLSVGRAAFAVAQVTGFAVVRENPSTPAAGLAATISSIYNTGWLVGDTRRAWAADTATAVVSSAELVVNGTFPADISGWTAIGAGDITNSWASGGLQMVRGAGAIAGRPQQQVPVTAGKTYRLIFDASTGVGYQVGSISGNSDIVGPTGVAAATGITAIFTVPTGASAFIQFWPGTPGGTTGIDNVSIKEVVADRSVKAKPLTVNGTLAMTAVATAAQLVAYSGFAAPNYLQEAYSADLDFGTGAWSVQASANIPAVLPAASFPTLTAELITNGDFAAGTTGWTQGAGGTQAVAAGQLTLTNGIGTEATSSTVATPLVGGKVYLLSVNKVSGASSGGVALGGTRYALSAGAGVKTMLLLCGGAAGSAQGLYLSTNTVINNDAVTFDDVSVKEIDLSVMFDRAAAGGARFRLGIDGTGRIVGEVSDTVTTRRVTSPQSYNTGIFCHPRLEYTTDGALTLKVNGQQVAQTTGAALLTLNNAAAVTTIGNGFALNAAFPGSIALVKVSATVPFAEQSAFMYAQEAEMFRDGAQVTLPDTGQVLDVAYDDFEDKLKVVTAANEASFVGLVRTSTAAAPSGAFSKTAMRGGVKLNARITTSPGVDVTLPSQGLREELVNRAEAAARLARLEEVLDFDAIVAQVDFPLPVGWTAKEVISAGASKREGSTKDFTRLYDGFKETIRFGAAPGAATWVQTKMRRMP